ncbi:MAG: LacI family DNA-binding transcriptional regulator [Fusobacteriota bacterium]
MSCTIKDIMKEVGVSRGTVSKALNNKKGVSEDLRKKIKKAAKELGYIPNSMARRLSTQKSNTIGVFLLNRDRMRLKENFGMQFLDGIAEEAGKKDYDILFFTITRQQKEKKNKKSYIELCKERSVEGAVFIGLEEDDLDLGNIKNSDIPVSVIDITINGKQVVNVTTDNEKGIRMGMDHLFKKGHKKIAFLKGSQGCEVSGIRYKTYKDIMKEKKIFKSEYVYEGKFSFKKGKEISKKILQLKEKPTAVLCANDQMALGLMEGFQAEGIKIPEDISVMGFDNIVSGEHSTPALTTIGQHAIEIGKEAFKGIFSKDKSKRVIEPELIIRGSVTENKN